MEPAWWEILLGGGLALLVILWFRPGIKAAMPIGVMVGIDPMAGWILSCSAFSNRPISSTPISYRSASARIKQVTSLGL